MRASGVGYSGGYVCVWGGGGWSWLSVGMGGRVTILYDGSLNMGLGLRLLCINKQRSRPMHFLYQSCDICFMGQFGRRTRW